MSNQLGDDVLAHGEHAEGLRWLVLRGPIGTPVAYVGIPEASPAAGIDYEDVPVDVHGGFTFSGAGDGVYRPTGWWWWGWDYAHWGDWTPYEAVVPCDQLHRWTTEEVVAEVQRVLPAFEAWLRLRGDEPAPPPRHRPTLQELVDQAEELFGPDWRTNV